jgi:hypothetical protein
MIDHNMFMDDDDNMMIKISLFHPWWYCYCFSLTHHSPFLGLQVLVTTTIMTIPTIRPTTVTAVAAMVVTVAAMVVTDADMALVATDVATVADTAVAEDMAGTDVATGPIAVGVVTTTMIIGNPTQLTAFNKNDQSLSLHQTGKVRSRDLSFAYPFWSRRCSIVIFMCVLHETKKERRKEGRKIKENDLQSSIAGSQHLYRYPLFNLIIIKLRLYIQGQCL